MLNFNSTENSSAIEVDPSRSKTLRKASFYLQTEFGHLYND